MTFFLEKVDQWLANPGLGSKRIRISQKPNLSVHVERKFKNHYSNALQHLLLSKHQLLYAK